MDGRIYDARVSAGHDARSRERWAELMFTSCLSYHIQTIFFSVRSFMKLHEHEQEQEQEKE